MMTTMPDSAPPEAGKTRAFRANALKTLNLDPASGRKVIIFHHFRRRQSLLIY
jgi:hypothetical protein